MTVNPLLWCLAAGVWLCPLWSLASEEQVVRLPVVRDT
jgi:hypothetical protein